MRSNKTTFRALPSIPRSVPERSMRANSPSALFASVSLHFLAAAVIVLFSLMIQRAQDEQKPPVIFDLVAGEPTESPERGLNVPADLKLSVPKVKLPPEPVKETVEPPPQRKEIPTPPKEVVKAPLKKEAKVVPKKEIVSYDDFRKSNPLPKNKTPAPPRPIRTPRIDTSKISGDTGKSGERGKALIASEVANQQAYEARLIAMLKVAHEDTKPTGLGDSVSAEVVFFLSADGQIRNVEISRSSGNAEFDRSVLAAIRQITWPGPRPDRKSDTLKVIFRMREL
ncbi:MAG: hypothetical protein C0518_16105 [Opitutus sp.]|nr:hypothetical protein [Opitutus sp.]